MLNTAEKKLYALVLGACAVSVLLGVVVGYLFFGRPTMYLGAPAQMAAAADALYAAEAPRADTVDFEAAAPAEYNETAAVSDVETHRYVVRIVDGYIAVFYADHAGGALREITTASAAALPAADIDELRAGINIYTEEALALLLQDYGS